MFWKLSERVALVLQPGDEDEKEIYTYGVWMLMTTFFNTMEILLLGMLFHRFSESVIYLAMLMILRTYTGGFHASTFQRCNATVLGCYAATLLMAEWLAGISSRWVAGGLVIAVIAVVARYAPMEHPNKPLTGAEKLRYRRYSLWLSTMILVLVLSLYDTYPNQMAYTTVSMLMVGGMMLFELILRKRRKEWNQD